MAKVKQSYVGTLNGGTTIGIQLPILVNSGKDGSYVIAANQIAWGESRFDDNTFGGTTEGLLTAIENKISTYAGNAFDRANAAYTCAVSAFDSANSAYDAAGVANNYADRAYTYASNIGADVDAAYSAAFDAKRRIDTFLDGEGLAHTVDSLKDIQDYIKTHGTEAANMVTNITAAQNRANAAYSYAESAFARANEAYNHADDAANNAQTNAYNAIDTRINEVRKQAYYRASEIETSIRSGELATEITYTFTSATSSQVKFISNINIISNRARPNDFEFRFTYYTPKAEDYWEEYVPAK